MTNSIDAYITNHRHLNIQLFFSNFTKSGLYAMSIKMIYLKNKLEECIPAHRTKRRYIVKRYTGHSLECCFAVRNYENFHIWFPRIIVFPFFLNQLLQVSCLFILFSFLSMYLSTGALQGPERKAIFPEAYRLYNFRSCCLHGMILCSHKVSILMYSWVPAMTWLLCKCLLLLDFLHCNFDPIIL